MLSVTKTPPILSFAGNDVFYEATTANFISSQGRIALMTIRVNGVDTTAGHTFKLQIGGVEYIFTLSASVGDDPLKVQVGYSGDTFSTFAQNLYFAFIGHYQIANAYRIILGNPGGSYRDITFQARDYGSAWSIYLVNVNTTGILSGGAIPGLDRVYRSNFGILMELFDQNRNKIGEDLKPVGAGGVATFNISEYLLAQLHLFDLNPYRFEWPHSTVANYAAYANYVIGFIAAFSEYIAGSVSKVTYDITRYAIGGGLCREAEVELNAVNLLFFSIAAVKKTFLTHAPLIRTTSVNVPEKLFFLFQDEKVQVQCYLMLKAYFSDGTSSVESEISPLLSPAAYSVYEFKVGYGQLNLATRYTNKTVLAWEVWLGANDGGRSKISDTRRFELDLAYRRFERIFIFRNSFSAYDVVRCTGMGEVNRSYDFSTTSTVVEDAPRAKNPPQGKHDIQVNAAQKINTGWISLTWYEFLNDLMLSKEVYEIIVERLVPVLITTKKTSRKEKENLISMEFEVQRAFSDSFHSRIPQLASMPGGDEELNDDQEMNDVQL